MEVEDTPLDISHQTSLLGIVAALLSWGTLYFTLCLWNGKQSKEWHCRSVTFIHAIVILCLCAWSAFIQGPWPYTRPGGPSTPLQQWICIICVGYFIFDFAWCLYFETEGATMMVHHVVSIVGNFIVIFRGWNGTEMIATIFGSEISNPLLQIRWFLRQSGKKESWAAEIVDALFMLTFGIMRIGLGTHLYYIYLNHPRADMVGKIGGLLIYLISWAFWIMMVQYAFRKYKKKYNAWLKRKKHRATEPCSTGYQINGRTKTNEHLHQTNGLVHNTNFKQD